MAIFACVENNIYTRIFIAALFYHDKRFSSVQSLSRVQLFETP